MNFTAIDVAQTVLALLLYVPVLLLPGLAIGGLAERSGAEARSLAGRWLMGLVIGFAVLPALDSMIVRFGGLGPAVAVTLVLAAAGLAAARGAGTPRLDPVAAAIGMLWLLIVLALTADLDWNGRLLQPTTVLDMVKHAATVRAILDSGAPPADPFFAREGVSGYYYFFYTLPAIASRLSLGWVEPRAAVAGLMVWTGIGLYGLALMAIRSANPADGISPRRIGLVLAALLFTTGLDIVPVAAAGFTTGAWIEGLEWWNEQVASWVTSCLWVPHHVAGLIAAMTGLMILAREVAQEHSRPDWRPDAVRLAVAALAFVSALGLSVWVTFGAVATAGIWAAVLAFERRWRALLVAAGTGIAALVLAIPALVDILANRAYGAFPIAPTIRTLSAWSIGMPPGLLNTVGSLALVPVNYTIEFGIFIVGAAAFWKQAGRAGLRDEVDRLLAIAAITSLLLGTFLRSVIISNDLGWRVVLLAQFAALVWTVRVIASRQLALRRPGSNAPSTAVWLIFAGYLAVAYDLVALRTIRGEVFTGVDPAVTRELRTTYAWLNTHLPASAVLQHDPTPDRVYDFGLYSRHRVGVADREAELFGASREAVFGRVAQLRPVFLDALPASEVRAAAARNGIEYLVVTARAPIWAERGSWLWNVEPVYRTERVRVIRVADLTTL